ncbi:hypothetical protein ABZ864_36100 [Streptomyces sp. NPDC047082]|uniref:hypothetical protein n=1 Tax=Streptomyces sp. NPDC047082 TaxID=3155259 RepID=UPI0033FBBEE9
MSMQNLPGRLLTVAGAVTGAVVALPVPLVQAQAAVASTSVRCSVADLISAANDSPGPDTLVLARKCTYRLTAPDTTNPANGLPVITGELTVKGNGATITRRRSAPKFRVLAVAENGNLTLNRATISGGSAPDCPIVPGVTAACGGGICNLGTLTVNDSKMRDNTATSDVFAEGGGIDSDGTATINNTEISHNSSVYNGTEEGGAADGGGIANDGPLTVKNSWVVGNSVKVTADTNSFAFGAGQASFADATVQHSTFSGNLASAPGGFARATLTVSTPGTLTVTDSVLRDNTADAPHGFAQGGALAGNSHLIVTRTLVLANHVTAQDGTAQGGGIRVAADGLLTIGDSTVRGNTAHAKGENGVAEGAGIDNPVGGTVEADRTWITGNIAYAPDGTSKGGGLYQAVGSATLTRSTVSGNRAGDGRRHLQGIRLGHAQRHQGTEQPSEQLQPAGQHHRLHRLSGRRHVKCRASRPIRSGSSGSGPCAAVHPEDCACYVGGAVAEEPCGGLGDFVRVRRPA